MLTVSVQMGDTRHSVQFQTIVGGRCGSKYCQPCRSEKGLEVDQSVFVRQRKKVDEDQDGSNRGGPRR